MFDPFPENYNWTLNLNVALSMGAEVSEIADIILRLKPHAAARDEERWAREWTGLSIRLERLAERDREHGHDLTAGRKMLRAAVAELMAERQRSNLDPGKAVCYERALRLFRDALKLTNTAVEYVEIPYAGTHLTGLFFPAATREQRAPCLIHFNGFDVTKEMVYLMHGYDLPPRGIAAIFVDQPGTGAAIRLQDLTIRPDAEVPASAVVDYLEGRSDIDPRRIGIAGISLGGYYAPRAAAFEKRIAACICWGACYSNEWVLLRNKWLINEMADGQKPVVPSFQARWVFGVESDNEVEQRLKLLTLEGMLDRVTCPLLILHGENDQHIPVEMARRTFGEAINAPLKELKTFGREEGGAEHCMHDNVTFGTDYFHDWLVDLFLGKHTASESSRGRAALSG